MIQSFKYKRRLIARPCAARGGRFASASVTKPPLRIACIRRIKRPLPSGDLLFLVSF